jgi:hypothetical protein
MWYIITMRSLETEFTWGGSGYAQSPRHFKQLKRNRWFALYQRSNPEGKIDCYEVVKIGLIKKGTVIKQFNKTYEDDQEFYPGNSTWGKQGWTLLTLLDAEKKFNELSKDFKKDYEKL